MRLNRKWILVIALVLSMATAISGTLAYLTSTDTAKNTFTVGNVSIDLIEEGWTEDSTPTLLPGVEIAKAPYIKNNGSTAAWVWMKITVPNDLLQYIDGWDTTGEWVRSDEPGTTTTVVTMKRETPLAAGAETAKAFTKVALDASLKTMPESLVTSGTVEIVVDAYAIQSDAAGNINDAITAFGANGEGGGEGGEGGEPSVSYTEVANADALSTALANGENVKLTESITTDGITIPSGKSVVVNLNGNQLIGSEYTKDDGSQSRNNVFVNNGNLTITGSGTITTRNLMNNSGAKLVINGNISIVGGVAAGGSAIWNEGDCEINGATISQTNDWNYAVQNIGTATMKITNATVSANHGAISNTSSGTLTIDGGDYTCLASGHTVYVTAGTVTINSGSFNHQQSNATAEGNVVIYANNGSVVVNGGSFDSVSAAFGYSSHKSNMTINESNCTFANAAANWYQ